MIERALDYAALAREGMPDTVIARRRRKSRGYVSVLRRLGEALLGLPVTEIRALQSPRIGFSLIQRLVRKDTTAVELRAQLRYAAGGMSTHTVRRLGETRRLQAASANDTTGQRRLGATRSVIRGFGWDTGLFADDPVQYLHDDAARLRGMQSFVEQRAARDVRTGSMARWASGVSIRRLHVLLRAYQEAQVTDGRAPVADPAGAAQQRALESLRLLSAGLEDAIARALAHLAEDPAIPSRTATASPGQAPDEAGSRTPGSTGILPEVLGEDALALLEADLSD